MIKLKTARGDRAITTGEDFNCLLGLSAENSLACLDSLIAERQDTESQNVINFFKSYPSTPEKRRQKRFALAFIGLKDQEIEL